MSGAIVACDVVKGVTYLLVQMGMFLVYMYIVNLIIRVQMNMLSIYLYTCTDGHIFNLLTCTDGHNTGILAIYLLVQMGIFSIYLYILRMGIKLVYCQSTYLYRWACYRHGTSCVHRSACSSRRTSCSPCCSGSGRRTRHCSSPWCCDRGEGGTALDTCSLLEQNIFKFFLILKYF